MDKNDETLPEDFKHKSSPEHDNETEASAKPAFTVNDRRFWTLSEGDLQAEVERPKQPTFIEQLQQQVDDKDKQLREYIAAYKKEVVEGLEKTKERLERDASQRMEQMRGQVISPMLEVLDALERSIAAAETSQDYSSLVQGIKMIQNLMIQKFQELGLSRVATVGQHFDPKLHDAVAVQPVSDPAQDNMVVAEFRPGFLMGERIIRPAYVQVGKLQQ